MLDSDRLKHDLTEYFGSATPFYPMAMMEVEDIKIATDDQLRNIANNSIFNPDDYETDDDYSLKLTR